MSGAGAYTATNGARHSLSRFSSDERIGPSRFLSTRDEEPWPHLHAKSRCLQVVHSIGYIAAMDMKEALRKKCGDRITITHQE
jgi:hypothetical protein